MNVVATDSVTGDTSWNPARSTGSATYESLLPVDSGYFLQNGASGVRNDYLLNIDNVGFTSLRKQPGTGLGWGWILWG